MLDRLEVINSLTKYPSIPTYHALGERGRLADEATPFTGPVTLTEQVDGAGTRIILSADGDYIIGSREHLLHARGDRVAPSVPPGKDIVDALHTLAEELTSPPATGMRVRHASGIRVYYLEVYGSNIGAANKQYTAGGQIGIRLFDVAEIPQDMLNATKAEAASWREGGGQTFADENTLLALAGQDNIPIVPRLGTVDGSSLPKDIEGMNQWLERALPCTGVALDDGAKGQSEGIVLRTPDRSVIAKARFENYWKTLGIKPPKK
ncbi:RNA ligase family protein [Streptomyces violaceusniger]|uniref:RNA ligase domain-containing protein n=1 Tax=Streptomyces violaceusniger (strain Tu 4113) TaxID=653045 RepID=G2PI12_STRV4|nr:RNA ligase family protein [Streptomyces violaceusniger]AEM88963.1 hypothetical protein Strvi_0190 [Streptomyces violaceusniger Tu 4113]